MMVRRLWIRLLAASAVLIVGCVNGRAITIGIVDPSPSTGVGYATSASPNPQASAAPSPRVSQSPTSSPTQATAAPVASPTPTATRTPSPTPIPDLWPSKDGLLVRVYRNGIKRQVYGRDGLYVYGSGYTAMISLNGTAYFAYGGIAYEEYWNDAGLFHGCSEKEYNDMIKPFRIDHADGPFSFTPTIMWNQGSWVDKCSLSPYDNGLNFLRRFPEWLNVTPTEGTIGQKWYYDRPVDTYKIRPAIDVFPIGGGASFSVSTAPLSLNIAPGYIDDSYRVAPARHGMFYLSTTGVLRYVSASSGRWAEVYRLPTADVTHPEQDHYSAGNGNIINYLTEVIDVAYDKAEDPKDDLLWMRMAPSFYQYENASVLLFLKVGLMDVDL